jgi:hypothetical protein
MEVFSAESPSTDAPVRCPQCALMCSNACSDLTLSVTVSAAAWASAFFGVSQ